MVSEGDYDERPSRRRGHDENRRDRDRDEDNHKRSRKSSPDNRRERRKSRERRRSRTPDSTDRQRRHRDRGQDRERERDRNRERDHDRDRRSSKRERERSRDDTRTSRRHHREEEDTRGNSHSGRQSPIKRSGPLPSQQDSFAITNGEEPEKPKEKPNFGSTGVLAAASNSVAQADGTSITLKYHEPAEARKPPPRDQWKLFVFKGSEIVDTIDLSLRSCWLIGRETAVVDLPAEHPSLSKQHAVIQFRHTEKRNEYGDKIGRVKPYLIDLESANGTKLNDSKIPDSRYLELRDKDMVQFGHSTREYVIMLAPKE